MNEATKQQLAPAEKQIREAVLVTLSSKDWKLDFNRLVDQVHSRNEHNRFANEVVEELRRAKR